MYCQKCGSKLADDVKFCKDCGFRVNGLSGDEKLPASALRRLANYFIDRVLGGIVFCFFFVAMWGVIRLLSNSGGLSPDSTFEKLLSVVMPILVMLSFVINPLYYLFFEGIWGRTLGKWITKTKVVGVNGQKARFSQILGRSFLRWIPFEAFSFLTSNNPVGWHDKFSKTIVVPASYTVEDVKNIDFSEAKKQKHSTGLFIVAIVGGIFIFIAIIGILASVVLAALSSARAKGQDAAIVADLSSLRVQAELYNSSNNSYYGFCHSAETLKSITSIPKVKDTDTICNDSDKGYAAASLMNSGGYSCVDNSGEVTSVNTSIGSRTSCTNSDSSDDSNTTIEQQYKGTFVNGCADDPAMRTYCACAYDALVDKLGIDGIQALSTEYKKTGKLTPEAMDAIKSCAPLLK